MECLQFYYPTAPKEQKLIRKKAMLQKSDLLQSPARPSKKKTNKINREGIYQVAARETFLQWYNSGKCQDVHSNFHF